LGVATVATTDHAVPWRFGAVSAPGPVKRRGFAGADASRAATRPEICGMGLVKRIGRSRAVQETLGFLLARYLDLVQATTRFQMDPPDIYDRVGPQMPVIAAMWHGQHFMVTFAKRRQDPAAALVSRSGDGEFNAIALRHLGVRAIRGSGARKA